MLNAVICRHALQKCHACRRKKILSGPVLLHPQTQPTTSPDSSCCTPRLNPPHPQTQPTAPLDQPTPTPNSNCSISRLKTQHPQTQTTAHLDSNHSTPRLKPQHPQTQHLCTRAVKPLLQPLKHFQISPATVLAINSWHTEWKHQNYEFLVISDFESPGCKVVDSRVLWVESGGAVGWV